MLSRSMPATAVTSTTRALDSAIALLSGPSDDRIVPASIYRRLTADLSANGCQVIGDLSGSQLKATLAGGPLLIKVSHEELLRDGLASSEQPTISWERCTHYAKTAPARWSCPVRRSRRWRSSMTRCSRCGCRRWSQPTRAVPVTR